MVIMTTMMMMTMTVTMILLLPCHSTKLHIFGGLASIVAVSSLDALDYNNYNRNHKEEDKLILTLSLAAI